MRVQKTGQNNYMLLFEIEDEGFIVGMENDLDSGKKRLGELWDQLNYSDEEPTHLFRYKIHDANKQIPGCAFGQTNGFYSVQLISLDNSISLDQLLRKRGALSLSCN